MKQSQKLFVYGTLKKDFPLHNTLDSADFVGKGYISGYAMYNLGSYPAAVRLPIGTVNKVHGEIYNVPNDLYPVIDQIEGAYEKDFVLVYPQMIVCNVYLMEPKRVAGQFEWIPGGNWTPELQRGSGAVQV